MSLFPLNITKFYFEISLLTSSIFCEKYMKLNTGFILFQYMHNKKLWYKSNKQKALKKFAFKFELGNPRFGDFSSGVLV